MTIERANAYSSANAALGWLVGVAYYGLWAAVAPGLPLWGYALLAVVGFFAAPLIVGGGLGVIAAGLTKLTTGAADRSPNAYAWAAFVSPVAAFWAVSWIIDRLS